MRVRPSPGLRPPSPRFAGRGAFVLAVTFLLAATAHGATAIGDPARGQLLFVTKGCVECHAVRGAGGRIGPDLGRSSVKGSFFEIVAAMWNHTQTMDEKMKELRLVRPRFEGTELSDLLAFLYFLNYFDEPGDARSGKSLFAEKHCIECHAIGKEGGHTGPRLDAFPRGTPPLQIAQDLWNHGPVMTSMMRARDLEVPTFRGNEIIDLFAYLRSQGQRHAPRAFKSAGDPDKGKKAFAAKGCSRCHSVFGRGGSIGPDLGRTELRGSVTQLAGRMWNHWPAMSGAMQSMGMATPVFRDEELADVFAYVFVSRYDAAEPTLDRGFAVYREKRCASCHGMRGEGGIGPPLAIINGAPKEEIARRMWNHAPEMGARMNDRQIAWPRFTADEFAALIRFVRHDATEKATR
jgi:mono/diheme cytochrome c family protein